MFVCNRLFLFILKFLIMVSYNCTLDQYGRNISENTVKYFGDAKITYSRQVLLQLREKPMSVERFPTLPNIKGVTMKENADPGQSIIESNTGASLKPTGRLVAMYGAGAA